MDSRRHITISPTSNTVRNAALAALNELGVGIFTPSGDAAIWTPCVAGWSEQLHAASGPTTDTAVLVGDLWIDRYCPWWDTHPAIRRA